MKPLSIYALAVKLPEAPGHPNRAPFTGILTLLDVPSTKAPGGSAGHLVLIREVDAKRMLPSLIGMGVNYRDDAKGHDQARKIGVITEAKIVDIDGTAAIAVAGLLYEADFPDEVAGIRANKHELGMSFELMMATIEDPQAEIWTITEGYFTGAAILRRDAAAYEATRLAAAREKAMDEKTIKDLLAAALVIALAEFKTSVIDPLVAEVRGAAEEAKVLAGKAMEAAKPAAPIKPDPAGTPDVEAIAAAAAVKVLAGLEPQKIAAAAAADANTALGVKVDKLVTDIGTLMAAAKSNGERRVTVPAGTVTLLASHGLADLDKDGTTFYSHEIDVILDKANVGREQRTSIKMQLQAAGKIKDAAAAA